MNLVKILANRINYGSKRNTNTIKWLVIHYTANDGDSAKGNGNYFKNNKLYLKYNNSTLVFYKK